jgi:uncharacterized membrane protein YidH (DUF202 family)
MQHHGLKLKMDILNIFCNLQVAITQKPGFERPTLSLSLVVVVVVVVVGIVVVVVVVVV